MAFFSKAAKVVFFGKDSKAMHDELAEAEERMAEIHSRTLKSRSEVEKIKARKVLGRRIPGMKFEGRTVKIVDLRDYAPTDIVTGDVIFDVSSQKLHKVCNTDGAGGLSLVTIDYDSVGDRYVSITERGGPITADKIAADAVTAATIYDTPLAESSQLSVTDDYATKGSFDDVLTILANDTTGKAAEIVRDVMMRKMMHEAEESTRVQASLAGLKAAGLTVEKAKATEAETKRKAEEERQRTYEADEKAGMF